jgi:malate dehydrogenase (oxaloacetate-decarboxylating)
MRAQLESHLTDVNRTADVGYDSGNPNDAIDLVVVTDSEAILGIGGESASGAASRTTSVCRLASTQLEKEI